jgi:hypothetical protein
MHARRQKLPQPFGGVRDGIGPGDAERVEAERAGLFGQRALGRGRSQKSRLA